MVSGRPASGRVVNWFRAMDRWLSGRQMGDPMTANAHGLRLTWASGSVGNNQRITADAAESK